MTKAPLLAALCLLTAPLAATAAGYKGSISFTPAEKSRHQSGLWTVMDASSRCLEEDLTRHKTFMKKYGISAFYGDNSSFAKNKSKDPVTGQEVASSTSDEEKRAILRRTYNVPEWLVQEFIPSKPCPNGTKDCANMMQPTSCIGLVMKCLRRGFERAGQEDLWRRVREFAVNNGVQGDALQVALQALGWQVLYWNPDTTRARAWDIQEQEEFPGNPKNIWGQHESTWRSVQTRQRYYLNTVDDHWSLVDFGRKPPRFIREIPFFVGIAHLGYHVFPGSYGQIIEGHSTRPLNDPESLESSEFNPLKIGGGPRGGPYKSGLVAIPPGYLY